MGVHIELDYDSGAHGELRCALTHGPSGTTIGTDAPKDNMGQGALFSPTDLAAAALVSCAVTTMAIKAKKEGIAFATAKAAVDKEMTTTPPRKIARLTVDITLSAALTPAERKRVEEFGNTCPVALSLSSDVQVVMRYRYS